MAQIMEHETRQIDAAHASGHGPIVDSERAGEETRARRAATTTLGRKLTVEFIGTFFLVFTVGTATNPKTGAGTLAPLAIGAALMVMVFAGGHISGGHYNPAVSTAVLIRGKLSREQWVSYVAIQLTAGALGGLLARAVVGAGHAGGPADTWKILIVESVFTFALAYVVLNVATASETEGNSFYGLAIGFTVVVGAFAVGGVSGGAFNPAVAVGASVLGIFSWSHLWIYLLAALLGGPLAAITFLYIDPTANSSSSVAGELERLSGLHEQGPPVR